MMFYCLRAKFLILFQCKPHVRGDGPTYAEMLNSIQTVNPTCVGMDRRSPVLPPGGRRKPHVRGDGPTISIDMVSIKT